MYYFLSLCKTFNELFSLYAPAPHCLTRPCFPKASAKVDTFTVNTKYYGHFFQAETLANLEKLPHISKEYAVKHIFNTRNHPRFKRKLFSKWKKEERKGTEKRGRETRERRRKRRKRAAEKRGNGTGKAGATRLKTRTRGTESPRTEKGRAARTTKRKRYRDERHTRKI